MEELLCIVVLMIADGEVPLKKAQGGRSLDRKNYL